MKCRWMSPCRSPSLAEQQHFCGPDAHDSTEEERADNWKFLSELELYYLSYQIVHITGSPFFKRFQAKRWLYIGVTPVSHKTYLQTAWRTPERLSSIWVNPSLQQVHVLLLVWRGKCSSQKNIFLLLRRGGLEEGPSGSQEQHVWLPASSTDWGH